MLANGWQPTLYYFNPNIFPEEEYLIRKNECTKYAAKSGVQIIDGDYDHAAWRRGITGLENEPERGKRCLQCFRIRMAAAAKKAHELGFTVFATTLASSRWKKLEQINAAGLEAAAAYPELRFWDNNWRKGGLQERRNALLKENGFYNQQYCGCEFALRTEIAEKQDYCSVSGKKESTNS